MDFELGIRNLGRFDDAKIRVGRFTVFAGPNNTGKSTAMRLLHALLDAMSANHAAISVGRYTKRLYELLDELESFEEASSLLPALREKSEALHDLVDKIPNGSLKGFDRVRDEASEAVTEMQEEFKEIQPHLEAVIKDRMKNDPAMDLDLRLSRTGDAIGNLWLAICATEPEDKDEIVRKGLEWKIGDALTHNFQVPRLSHLIREGSTEGRLRIDDLCDLLVTKDEVYVRSADLSGLEKRMRASRAIYLESPEYWKLKNALEDLLGDPRYKRKPGRDRVTGVPSYFHDLASAIMRDYIEEPAFPDLYERLTGKDVLGGKIVVSDNGSLAFRENGRSFPLQMTAMGVANLGMLALLIERKVLEKGAYLFVDEPEAHLHPAWQVVMAESLFELAKGGVNVVIATHSSDILKWLEVHVKRHPDDGNLIALNRFSVEGVDQEDRDFDEKMAIIRKELTDPFAKLYMSGLYYDS